MIASRVAAVTLAGSMCIAIHAHAQMRSAEYPQRPIRIILGIAPAGAMDAMTRVAAQKLSARFGQIVVVDNRPGGGTVIAMDLVQQAASDGYTLLCASETLMLNGVLNRARYDVRKAFVPVARLTTQPYLLAVNPSLPITSVTELIAYAKARPGVLSYGTPGVGTTLHIGWERFIAMSGIHVVHVPYTGGAPAAIDVMSGQIQMLITTTVTAGPHMKSGKLRVIAVTGPRRVPVYPELPTVSESGLPGFELTNSYALHAPGGTPDAIVRKINAAVIEVMNSPETRRILAPEGAEAAPPATPGEFKAKFARDYAELEKTIVAAKISLQ